MTSSPTLASSRECAVYDEQVKPQLLPDPCTPGPVREALHRVVDAAWANSTREILHPGGAQPAPSNRSPVLSEAAAVREDATAFDVRWEGREGKGRESCVSYVLNTACRFFFIIFLRGETVLLRVDK